MNKRGWSSMMGSGGQSLAQKKLRAAAAVKSVVKGGRAKPSYQSDFAKKVKAVMYRAAEKKQVDSQLGSTYFGSSATSNALALVMTPNASTLGVIQGTAVNQRVGNRIRIKKATFKGSLCAAVYNVSYNAIPEPQHVKFYFVSSKLDPNAVVNPLVSPFYRLSGTTTAQSGSMTDPWLPIDHESITEYHSKVFKVGYQEFNTTGTLTSADGWSNNNFPLVQDFEFDITKWMPTEIVWDDSGTTPTSRALTCVIEATNACSGTAQGTTQSLTTGINYCIHIEYCDV